MFHFHEALNDSKTEKQLYVRNPAIGKKKLINCSNGFVFDQGQCEKQTLHLYFTLGKLFVTLQNDALCTRVY